MLPAKSFCSGLPLLRFSFQSNAEFKGASLEEPFREPLRKRDGEPYLVSSGVHGSSSVYSASVAPGLSEHSRIAISLVGLLKRFSIA